MAGYNTDKIGFENPILSKSTLTNDKIALKYTVLFLFMDIAWFNPCCFHCKICKNSLF